MSALRILVDADACPVKDEVYKVAWRRDVPVTLVSNAYFRVPDHPLIERVVVSDGFDAADDWIADAATRESVVITGDILLADRCLKKGATVIGNNGKPFTAGKYRRRNCDPGDHGGPPRRRWSYRRAGALRQGRPLAFSAVAR